MSINVFDLQFFELVNLLKTPLTQETVSSLRKTLLKLKNPTYYTKYTQAHPANMHGYYATKNINPVLVAVSNMLEILKNLENAEDKRVALQKEYAWAFNNYVWYTNLLNINNK
jgi:hypothetical protein